MTPRARRLKRYGLTVQLYNALLKKQHGRCAICFRLPKNRRLHVDHDHTLKGIKSVRGLLCYTCNRFYVAKNNMTTAGQVHRYLWNYEQRVRPYEP